jgi:hypothetical protein
MLFIDFSSAYNTVIRSKLYKRIREKDILSEEEVKFLELLHSKIYFKAIDKTYYFNNGHPH